MARRNGKTVRNSARSTSRRAQVSKEARRIHREGVLLGPDYAFMAGSNRTLRMAG